MLSEHKIDRGDSLMARPSGHASGIWREEVLGRAARIEQKLAALNGGRPRRLPEQFEKEQVAGRTSKARQYVNQHASLRQRWAGVQIEDCWRELRLAEEGLIYLSPSAQLRSSGNDVLNHAQQYLPAGDKRVEHLQEILGKEDSSDEDLRSSILPVLSAGHEASDKAHQALRSFQNQLRVLAAALFLMAIVTSILAFTLTGPALVPIPVGLSQGWAFVLILAAGGFGALFSAIPSLAQIPEKAVPFNPVLEQASLKVAVGVWSGFVGLLVVSAGLESATADSSTLAGMLIVAALFGASQEALTRFADHKASSLRAT